MVGLIKKSAYVINEWPPRRFALEGADVLLAAKMSKSFNEDSHESIKVTGEDILDDDIHLILVKRIHFLKERKNITKL